MVKTLEDLFGSMGGRITDLERRRANGVRHGTIAEIGTGENAGRYRVRLSNQRGRPFLTDWIKAKAIAAGGVKIDILRSVGEQVQLTSENGDMTDAMIDLSSYSDENSRENVDTPLHIKIGSTVIAASGDEVRISASKIVLDGEVHLGGEGGKALHRKGDDDSSGDIAVGAATKVFAL